MITLRGGEYTFNLMWLLGMNIYIALPWIIGACIGIALRKWQM